MINTLFSYWALSGLQEFKTFDFVSEDLRVDLD